MLISVTSYTLDFVRERLADIQEILRRGPLDPDEQGALADHAARASQLLQPDHIQVDYLMEMDSTQF